jgi:hypothetical protein
MTIIESFAALGYLFFFSFVLGFGFFFGASSVPDVGRFFSWLAGRFSKRKPRP